MRGQRLKIVYMCYLLGRLLWALKLTIESFTYSQALIQGVKRAPTETAMHSPCHVQVQNSLVNWIHVISCAP